MKIWKYENMENDGSENSVGKPVFLGEFSCVLSFPYIIR